MSNFFPTSAFKWIDPKILIQINVATTDPKVVL